jgi:hypothetical protein
MLRLVKCDTLLAYMNIAYSNKIQTNHYLVNKSLQVYLDN